MKVESQKGKSIDSESEKKNSTASSKQTADVIEKLSPEGRLILLKLLNSKG